MKKLISILLFLGLCLIAKSQVPSEGLVVVQFNAGFNEANKVPWVNKLSDCSTKFIDIQKDTKAAGKYKVVVVPTIIIFKDGEEVARYQANIMMVMETTKGEIQVKIDEILMESI